MEISPAQSFGLKKVGTEGFPESDGAIDIDFTPRYPLITERINLWNIFSEKADGCWFWNLYYMGTFTSDDDSRRKSVFYNGKTIGMADEQNVSFKIRNDGRRKG